MTTATRTDRLPMTAADVDRERVQCETHKAELETAALELDKKAAIAAAVGGGDAEKLQDRADKARAEIAVIAERLAALRKQQVRLAEIEKAVHEAQLLKRAEALRKTLPAAQAEAVRLDRRASVILIALCEFLATEWPATYERLRLTHGEVRAVESVAPDLRLNVPSWPNAPLGVPGRSRYDRRALMAELAAEKRRGSPDLARLASLLTSDADPDLRREAKKLLEGLR